MKYYRDRYETFVFTHIPKCGGSSFRKYVFENAISSGVSESKIYIPQFSGISNNENLSQLNEKKLTILRDKQLVVLADHSKFNAHKTYALNMKSPYYYTILRNPVDRFISHYKFFYFKQGYGNLKGVHLNDLSNQQLNKLLNSIGNLMVDYLSNRNVNKEPVITRKIFQRAVYNLENHVACFGLLEQIEKSLELLSLYSPSWIEFNSIFPFVNKTKVDKNFEPVSDSIRGLIAEKNDFDMKLYDFAKQLFKLRYDAYK